MKTSHGVALAVILSVPVVLFQIGAHKNEQNVEADRQAAIREFQEANKPENIVKRHHEIEAAEAEYQRKKADAERHAREEQYRQMQENVAREAYEREQARQRALLDSYGVKQ